MEHDYSQMSRQELIAARDRLAEDLADYEELANFHSAFSPSHTSATKMQTEHAKQQRFRDRIAEIDRLLADAAG